MTVTSATRISISRRDLAASGIVTATNAAFRSALVDATASSFFQHASRCVETSFLRANPTALSAVRANSSSCLRASASLHRRHARSPSTVFVFRVIPRA